MFFLICFLIINYIINLLFFVYILYEKTKITDKIETDRLIIEVPNMNDTKNYTLIDDDVVEFMYWSNQKDYKRIRKSYK